MKSGTPPAPESAEAKKGPAAPRADRRRRVIIKWSVLAVVTGICVGLCLWTTYLAEQHLVIGEVNKILPFLWLERTANSGVAFGLLGGRLAVILAANAVAILVVLVYVYMDKRVHSARHRGRDGSGR